MANKYDSNMTGLRYCEEESLRKLPPAPNFIQLEPNSYSDFGSTTTTVARSPINPSRQRRKGVVTDLEASGGFNQDLTMLNSLHLLQGFFFADARQKFSTHTLKDNIKKPITVTTTGYAIPDSALPKGAVILASGFDNYKNNGLKTLADAATATEITTAGLVAEPSNNKSKVEHVGQTFAAGAAKLAMNGKLVQLQIPTADTMGLVEGEWIWIGGNTAASQFASGGGIARVSKITPTHLELDKVDWEAVADTGAGKSITIYFATVLKNENGKCAIKRRSYHLERVYQNCEEGDMAEYLVGAVPNELTLNIPQADKVNMDLSFVALDNLQRSSAEGLIAGTRTDLPFADAINTTYDFARIKMSKVDPTNANVEPLFAFATEMTLTIANNVTPSKAIGTLGAFDTNIGNFDVGGSSTVYFADMESVKAVRENADVTLDFCVVKDYQGMVFDIPLLSLGDGRLSVEADSPVTLPLENTAAESVFGHTLLMCHFPYLPKA